LAVKTLIPNRTEFAPGDVAALCDAAYGQLAQVIEEQARAFEDRSPLEAEINARRDATAGAGGGRAGNRGRARRRRGARTGRVLGPAGTGSPVNLLRSDKQPPATSVQ
jgi:hypothetical protein